MRIGNLSFHQPPPSSQRFFGLWSPSWRSHQTPQQAPKAQQSLSQKYAQNNPQNHQNQGAKSSPLPTLFAPAPYTEINLESGFRAESANLGSLDTSVLPRGEMCDWLSPSRRQQQDTLLNVVAALNHQHWRCALIDCADSLGSPRWRLLTSSGRNWLVKPDDLRSALRCALMLLWSGRFRLITLSGLSPEEIHPEDGAMLRASIPLGSTLLFTQCTSWDGSGEPLAVTEQSPWDMDPWILPFAVG